MENLQSEMIKTYIKKLENSINRDQSKFETLQAAMDEGCNLLGLRMQKDKDVESVTYVSIKGDDVPKILTLTKEFFLNKIEVSELSIAQLEKDLNNLEKKQ